MDVGRFSPGGGSYAVQIREDARSELQSSSQLLSRLRATSSRNIQNHPRVQNHSDLHAELSLAPFRQSLHTLFNLSIKAGAIPLNGALRILHKEETKGRIVFMVGRGVTRNQWGQRSTARDGNGS